MGFLARFLKICLQEAAGSSSSLRWRVQGWRESIYRTYHRVFIARIIGWMSGPTSFLGGEYPT